jgi:ElaB/YqjD/DUF883 family membrane-anchored ribosome-binding protein
MTANAEQNDKLVADLKRVVRDSEQLLQDSAGVVGEKAHELRERLADTVEVAKATYVRLQESAKKGAKATDQAIREHPYHAMGIAFGLGVLIGVLARRK